MHCRYCREYVFVKKEMKLFDGQRNTNGVACAFIAADLKRAVMLLNITQGQGNLKTGSHHVAGAFERFGKLLPDVFRKGRRIVTDIQLDLLFIRQVMSLDGDSACLWPEIIVSMDNQVDDDFFKAVRIHPDLRNGLVLQ